MSHLKVCALFDIHYPYNIDLKPVLNFMADFKPDRVIFGGDTLDLAYLSHWNEMSPGKWEGHDVYEDFEAIGRLIDDIKRKVKPSKIDYLIGNHEDWIRQFTDKFPQLRKSLDIGIGLKAKERDINIVPFNKFVKIGHLYFLHGIYCNEYHARKTVLAYQRCVRYGHTHDYQAHTIVSPLDTHKVFNAISCGCLCNRNSEYNHGRPNKWAHGFYIAYVNKDGTFTDSFIPIIKNRFTWNGKEYK